MYCLCLSKMLLQEVTFWIANPPLSGTLDLKVLKLCDVNFFQQPNASLPRSKSGSNYSNNNWHTTFPLVQPHVLILIAPTELYIHLQYPLSSIFN